MENKEFEIDGRRVNVLIDYDNNEVWLSQKNMALLFNKSTDNISLHIKNIKSGRKKNIDSVFKENLKTDSVITKNEITDSVTEEYSDTVCIFAITGLDGKTYNVKHYNLDIILQVGYKCNYEIIVKFKEWVDNLFNEYNDIINSNKWLNKAKNYEIVKFESGNLSLDINVSPSEDTVWLTQQDMAVLFETTKQNISLHIINIFNENELEKIQLSRNP